MVLNTTFEQSQKWSYYRNFTAYIDIYIYIYIRKIFSLQKPFMKADLKNPQTVIARPFISLKLTLFLYKKKKKIEIFLFFVLQTYVVGTC